MRVWLIRAALVAAGVSVMWLEGQHQPAPGVGFAVAMVLILGAAFVPSARSTD